MNWTFVADAGPWQTYHVGDEAMLDANLGLFRSIDPSANLIVVSSDPDFTAKEYGVDAVARPGFDRCSSEQESYSLLRSLDAAELSDLDTPAAFRRLAGASDGLVISGGGNLNSTWPQFIYERLAFCRRAAAHHLPIIILGQTIGPNLAGPHREMVGEILRSAWWVGVRDAVSYETCLKLGVPMSRLSYQTDDAAFFEGAAAEAALPFPASDEWIGVTIHPLADPMSDDQVLDLLAAQLTGIAASTNAHLVFIPHACASPRMGAPWSDEEIGRSLAARMRQTPLHVLPLMRGREAAALTRRAAMIISSRYHPLVFALPAGIPCVGIWTDQYTLVKLTGAAAHYQVEPNLVAIADVGTGRFSTLVDKLWSERHRRGGSDPIDSCLASEQLRLQQLSQLVRQRTPTVPPQPARLLRDLAATLRQIELNPAPDDLLLRSYDETVAYALSLKAETERLSDLLRQAALENQRLGQSRDEAIGYAVDLEANLDALSTALRDAVSYTETVEHAREDLTAKLRDAMAYAATLEHARAELSAKLMETTTYTATLEHARAELSAKLVETTTYTATLEHARAELGARLSEATTYAVTLERARDDLESYAKSSARRLRELEN